MKFKFKIAILSLLILSLGACNNSTPTYTEVEKANFNVQEENQLFAMGNYKINDSGVAVAQMNAKEKAYENLKKQIFNEATNALNSFFNEIKIKSITISNDTVKDLATLTSSKLINEAVITNSWNKDGEEFVVLAIDKKRVPEEIRSLFSTHIQEIINVLNRTINKVSNEYLEIFQAPPIPQVQGSSKVSDSGIDVAKMNAKESAETSLKKEIYNVTFNTLTLFFNQINTKTITIPKDTIKDLSSMISKQLIKEAKTVNTWNDEGKEFISLEIDETRVPETIKDTFVYYLQSIIDHLDDSIDKVSNKSNNTPTITKATAIKEVQSTTNNSTPIKKEAEVEKNPETDTIETDTEDFLDDNDTNGEPEVYLDDF